MENNNFNNEIDFAKIFNKIKASYKLISISILLALIFASIKIYLSPTVYETKIPYEIYPTYQLDAFSEKINDRLLIEINDEDNFKNWSKEKNNLNISFKDIKNFETIEGVDYKLNSSDMLWLNMKGQFLIRTNNQNIISNFIDYLEFINETLKKIYEVNLLSQISLIENIQSVGPQTHANLSKLLLEKKISIEEIRNNKPIALGYRSKSVKVFPIIQNIYLTYSITGLLFGIIFALFRSSKS